MRVKLVDGDAMKTASWYTSGSVVVVWCDATAPAVIVASTDPSEVGMRYHREYL